MTNKKHYDAIVIGAGFGGIYSIYKLKNELGLDVIGYEKGAEVGGTWFWNRYPGALSDSESYVYQYSFDKELYNDFKWTHTYLTQPQVNGYLNHVADRYDLRGSFQFNTTVTAAHFKEDKNIWEVTTDKGDTVTAKYLITGLGLLSAANIPNFKGRETFQGEQYHTARWPENVDLKGKRVGVIGNGSTGVQLITAIAPEVGHLSVFQRTPQYSVPLGYREQSDEEIKGIKDKFDEVWDFTKNSQTAQGCEESDISTFDVSDAEREKIYEWGWNKGGGFRFMFGTFNDMAIDPKANELATNFIKKKIKEIVKDPVTAEKLTPEGLHAKRPLADNGYFQTFNRDNVSLVDVKENPIVEITPKGIRTTDNEYELDVIIFATGFDAIEGNYMKIDLRGRNGVTINEKWADGPTGYLATTNSDFPNMFMVLGPNGPFTNLATAAEVQIDWIGDTLKHMIDNNHQTIEPTEDMEKEWVKICKDISDSTLFSKVDSWIFGANIPGKKNAIRFYMGGMGTYRKEMKERGYNGFIFDKKLIGQK